MESYENVKTASCVPAAPERETLGHLAPPMRIAFLGNYVPRLCGIATFTHDLCEAVAGAVPAAQCYVGAVNDRVEGYEYPSRVRFELLEKDLDSYRRAADFLNFNNADVLCVQHEFGIYGGPAGSHLLALLKEVRMPVVTTLHTVLREPNAAQRAVMEELVQRSDRVGGDGAEGRGDSCAIHMRCRMPKWMSFPTASPIFRSRIPALSRSSSESRDELYCSPSACLDRARVSNMSSRRCREIVQTHPNVVYLVLGCDASAPAGA